MHCLNYIYTTRGHFTVCYLKMRVIYSSAAVSANPNGAFYFCVSEKGIPGEARERCGFPALCVYNFVLIENCIFVYTNVLF